MINLIKAVFSFRNLLIFFLGGLAMVILLLIIQLIIWGSLYGFWDNDLILPILIGGFIAINRFEKPFFDK